jgi:hypothetical protein
MAYGYIGSMKAKPGRRDDVVSILEHHDASLRLPATRAAVGEAMPMLTGEFTGCDLTVAGGLGVVTGAAGPRASSDRMSRTRPRASTCCSTRWSPASRGTLACTRGLTTDVQLAAYAIEHQGEMYSNDPDFARFPNLKWVNPLR